MSQQFKSRRQREAQTRRKPNVLPRQDGFVRSRTLTGSQSRQVSAANEKRGFLVSPRLKTQDLKKRRRLIATATIVAWVAVGGMVFLIDQYIGRPQLQLSNSIVAPQLTQNLEGHTQDYFNNRPLERFRFAVDKEQFNNYMMSKVPELSNIEVVRAEGFSSSTAEVDLRRPVAKWVLDGTTYYVDASGQAFHQNYYEEPAVSVRDNSGLPPDEQQRLASRRLLYFIGQTVEAINVADRLGQVEEVIIPPTSLKAIDVRLEGRGYRLKLHTDRAIGSQVADIESAVNYIERQKLTPRYIDLRVAGKAFYR